MVVTVDTGAVPLTAIWSVREVDSRGNEKGPFRAVVVHWNKINYAKEKLSVAEGRHPDFQYMGDIIDPRSSQKYPDNLIENAIVEGRVLETFFVEKPWKENSPRTGDRFTFMIDGDAKKGAIPRYNNGDKAYVCGMATHTHDGRKGEMLIKPIYKDDFECWGHLDQGNTRWRIIPMYFIPHGSGIQELTDEKYTFKPRPAPSNFKQPLTGRVVASPVHSRLVSRPAVDDSQEAATGFATAPQNSTADPVPDANLQDPTADPAQGTGTEDPFGNGVPVVKTNGTKHGLFADTEISVETAEQEAAAPVDQVDQDEEEQSFKKELDEKDFGEEAVAADAKAAAEETNW